MVTSPITYADLSPPFYKDLVITSAHLDDLGQSLHLSILT